MAGDAVLTEDAAKELIEDGETPGAPEHKVIDPTQLRTINVSVTVHINKFGSITTEEPGLAAYTPIGLWVHGEWINGPVDAVIPYTSIKLIEFHFPVDDEQEDDGDGTSD